MKILPAFLDATTLPRAIGQTFQYAWRDGANPVTEAIACLLGSNTWAFFVPLKSGWKASAIAPLLSNYGITMFGVFEFRGELVFAVRSGQAHFAQWLLLREGVPLLHGLLTDSAGRIYGPHSPDVGSAVRQPIDGGHDGNSGRESGRETQAAQKQTSSILEQIDRWLGPSTV